jgi:hypothetical protein
MEHQLLLNDIEDEFKEHKVLCFDHQATTYLAKELSRSRIKSVWEMFFENGIEHSYESLGILCVAGNATPEKLIREYDAQSLLNGE